jgi:hypothetical protein
MTKSALRVAREALAAGAAALPSYGSHFARRDYTQPQLFALPVVRQFLKADHRGVVALTTEGRELREARAGARQGPAPLDARARGTAAARRGRKRGTFRHAQAALIGRARAEGLLGAAAVAAADATGLEARHVSAYFGLRRAAGQGHRQRAWPKLTAVVDSGSHLIAGAAPGVGPSQDSPDSAPAVRQAAELAALDTVLADAGYDAGHDHRLCREDLGVRQVVIALNPRDTGDRWPAAPYRRAMRLDFPGGACRQRWHAESAFSQHKRRLGSALTARGTAAQQIELVLRVLTHNLALIAGAG